VGARRGSGTRRIGVVVAVCLGHALAIWQLFEGGIVRVVPDANAPVQIINIPERHKPPESTPPVRLQASLGVSIPALAARISVPLPLINIDLPTDAPVTSITNPSSASGDAAGLGGLGAGHGSGAKIDVQIVLTHWLTPTGIQLVKGQTILITARGTLNWYTGHCNECTSTPDGAPCNGSDFYTPLPCYSLIGRIGPHGRPFEVGSYKILIADSSGELFLGVNDNYYPDNTGKWVATLSAVSAPTRSAVR
jgi:hypothetical protein